MTSKWGFVSKQLREVDAGPSQGEATVELLQALEAAAEKYELTDEEQSLVLDYVQKLAKGHALTGDTPDEQWGDVVPGEYGIGDTVRVKADAYVGDHGLRHNGKRGRVAAVHQAKVVVIYDDAASSEESFYHEPFTLERLL